MVTNKKDEALKQALEALETLMLERGSIYENAIIAIREALADSALDRMAENARELGLDYEPPCKTGSQCTSKCPQCEQPAQDAAIKTLEHLGYTYHGGEQWKPPLGQPAQQQEHVSVMTVLHLKDRTEIGYGPASAGYDLPTGEYKLYTFPQPSKPTGVKPWVGLTSQEVYACADESGLPQELSTGDLQAFGQAIEAKLKEKNA